ISCCLPKFSLRRMPASRATTTAQSSSRSKVALKRRRSFRGGPDPASTGGGLRDILGLGLLGGILLAHGRRRPVAIRRSAHAALALILQLVEPRVDPAARQKLL